MFLSAFSMLPVCYVCVCSRNRHKAIFCSVSGSSSTDADRPAPGVRPISLPTNSPETQSPPPLTDENRWDDALVAGQSAPVDLERELFMYKSHQIDADGEPQIREDPQHRLSESIVCRSGGRRTF